jgi:ATP-dependent Lon protease
LNKDIIDSLDLDNNGGDADSYEPLSLHIDENNIVDLDNISHIKGLYILPITRRPFFPGMAAPIIIEPGPFYEVLKLVANSKNKLVGLVLTKEEDADPITVGFKGLNKVGVLAHILRIIPIEGGGAQIILSMEKRITIKGSKSEKPHLRAAVDIYDDKSSRTSKTLKAYSMSIIATIKDLLKVNPIFQEELQIFLGHSDFTEPGKLADFAVALTTASREELQDVLETFSIRERTEKTLMLLKKELDISKLQNTINKKIERNLSKSQREFFLTEQLKTIKKELGMEKDEKTSDIEKFKKRLESRVVSENVQKVIDDEIEKLSALEPQSAEYAVSRGYLDWLTIMPWGVVSEDANSFSEAEDILEKDHYGLEDIKKRILEFIGVGKLSGGVKGSIICFVGPPGVGKTSVGMSIARALNREFYRFSVGGVRDEAEIKGHRRTYIGAMPGKISQALKITGTMNPVIMIDEIDKMSVSYQGDPAAAMMEVLDPDQNVAFVDHYLDVPCDLSDVLFIVTANVLDTIPEPLQDRMDIMRLSGYIREEKMEIAKRYLVPKNRKKMGLKSKDLAFSQRGIHAIIEGYAREPGVRTLENLIKKIMRKVAVKIVKASEGKTGKKKRATKKKPHKKYSLTTANIEEYLDKPLFDSEKYYKRTPVGVAMGLAWTSHGGTTLYIESIRVKSEKLLLQLTGQAGDVMKESSEIAWSFIHSAIGRYAPDVPFFEGEQVHMHIPEGAVPKDGPSAGITMATSLLSLVTGTPILHNLAMTGELTLTGRVLAIGGLKEKMIAAKRSGVTTIILPKDNLRNYDKIPDHIKEGLTAHMVEYFDEVIDIAFPKGFKKKKGAKKR